jgi:beta-glucanase (GH16 family)
MNRRTMALATGAALIAACSGEIAEPGSGEDPGSSAAITGSEVALISGAATWRYDDGAPTADTSWRSPSFNDSAWKQGKGEFGYGDGDETTTISAGSPRSISAKFRHTFNVANPAAYAALTARFIRDDGVVIYLNGVEVVRDNMPAGAIGGTTPASSYTNDGEETELRERNIALGRLKAGANVLAVEVHQASAGSSDLSFWLELAATPVPTGPVTLIAAGDAWRYRDNGETYDAAWTGVAFDDSAWKSGQAQLGCGEGDEKTVVANRVSVRFRRTFNVVSAAAFTGLTANLVRDDGAVVYLNGKEVARNNMPSGAITSTTLASTNIAGSAEAKALTLSLPASALRDGANVIAVELHQAWASSSDLSFSLALEGQATGPVADPEPTPEPTPNPTPVPTGCENDPTACDPLRAGWKLYFRDEFSGTKLDTGVWKPYHNNYGSGNNEKACLTPNNVAVSGGALVITSRKETVACPNAGTYNYTSGFVGTRETGHYFPRFARYEMRAKIPHMHALWPAFWLRHRDGSSKAEIDVMEYFHAQSPGKTTSTIHYNGVANVAKGVSTFEAPTLNPGWHTWAVEMLPSGTKVCIQYFVDEKPMPFYNQPAGPYCVDKIQFDKYPGENLFDIALNMAIGGNWVGDPDSADLTKLQNGNNAATSGVRPTTFPTSYYVDYVRVYTK